jgi:DNA-binding transcriptional LysR family regulator
LSAGSPSLGKRQTLPASQYCDTPRAGQDAKRAIPTGVFRTSDIEQMRMGVLEHLGIARAPAWLFAAELREGTVVRLLTAFEQTVPILAVRPASRRLSTKVRIFIEHLEKTMLFPSNLSLI